MAENGGQNEPLTRAKLTQKQETAAALVAADLLTNAQIAAQVDAGERTIDRWKTLPEFQAAVAEHAKVFIESARRDGIARIETRVAALNDRWRKAMAVMAARGIDMADESIAGGSTGLLCRQVKFVKVFELRKEKQHALDEGEISEEDLTDNDFIATKATMAVTEYAVDTPLLAEIRALEMQAAKELGQMIDRSETVNKTDYSKMSDEELEALRK